MTLRSPARKMLSLIRVTVAPWIFPPKAKRRALSGRKERHCTRDDVVYVEAVLVERDLRRSGRAESVHTEHAAAARADIAVPTLAHAELHGEARRDLRR